MYNRYVLLAILLIQTFCASVVGARGSAITGRASLMPNTTFPCTLDVVLVTFQNATTGARGLDYHLHDRPHGSNDDGMYPDPDSSYTLRDFERLFNGGYGSLEELPFVGDTVTVANGHTLPEVFGSVRAYYDSVSNGAFQLHVRMINPADNGFPRWVELPQTKAHYDGIDLTGGNHQFWQDAYAAAWDSVRCWNPNIVPPSSLTCGASITGYAIDDLPNNSYNTARRLRRKVVYLYSGTTYDNYALLHPHADVVTRTNRTGMPTLVGYRYVMGERQGWGLHNDYDIDRFAGIGMHAHEIGHLLGLHHGDGLWTTPDNRYVRDVQEYTNDDGANMMGWTLMQGGGEQGPILRDDGYYVGYRSCPNPINPFYLMDLGWINPPTISGSQDNYAIAAGTTHRIDRGEVSYLLNRRTTQPFGGRYLAFYDYAAEASEDQGLMIWRREINGEERPILIVADGRRYRDARNREQRPLIPEYYDMLSDPFPGSANITAVNALADSVGLRQKTYPSTDRNGNLLGENVDPGRLNLALTNITYNSTTDVITVDIYMAPPSLPTNLMAATQNGQVTLSWRPPSDPGPPPSYEYQQSTDSGNNWGEAMPVDADACSQTPGGNNVCSQTINGLTNSTDNAFAVRAVNPVGSSDWVSIRPLVLAGSTAIEGFSEVVSPEPGRRTVANYTATDPEGGSITWSLGGTDAADFLLSPNGQLTFRTGPDFEDPTDQDTDNIYQVTVQASAGQQSAALDVTVTVTNANDPGVLSLGTSPPQVGVPLTAKLTDPDGGVKHLSWQWHGQQPPTTVWRSLMEEGSDNSSASYTPKAEQVGWALRAMVKSYHDTLGGNSTVTSTTTDPVRAGVPGAPPNFIPSPGDGRVVLGWDAASTNGSPITRYDVQWRVANSGHGWPGWSPVLGGGTARDSTVTGLTNGVLYEFAVRAVNSAGGGLTASQSTMPQAPPQNWSGTASFGAVSYQATEGGASASITVSLSPAPPQTLHIPVVVSADAGTEAGDYAVANLTDGTVWLSFAAGTSSQSFTLTANEDTDIADETVTLSFGSLVSGVAIGTTRQATVTLLDNDTDLMPTFASLGTSRAAVAGQYFSFTRPAASGGNAPLSYSASGACSGLAIRASSASGVPNSIGQCRITWTVTDSDGDTDTYLLRVAVVADTEPTFASSGASRSVIAGQSLSFTRPSASGGNAPLSYSVSGTCPGLTATASGVSGSPTTAGEYAITWTVRDTDGDTDTYSLQVAVAADASPTFAASGVSRSVIAGQSFSFTRPSASGGNLPLTYSVSGTCAGLTVTSSAVSGSPGTAGQCGITWTVRDTDGDTDTYSLQVAVAADTSPTFAASGASAGAIVGQPFSFSRPSASGGNAPLGYSVSGTCPGLTVAASSVSGSPTTAGEYAITWTVTDTDGDTDTYSLQVAVAADTSPTFASSSTSEDAIVGVNFSFTRPSASGGNSPLTYSVNGTCDGLTVTTSAVSGKPTTTGQCGISWTVRDTDGDTDTHSLQISVAADTSPTFASSGASEGAIVGQPFSFSRPSASGGNLPLTYSVSGTCPGLTVTTSAVSGSPTTAGEYAITWTVTDADSDTDTYSLQVTVAADTSPTFAASSTSRSAIVGQSFSFSRPSASGGNSPLTYSVNGSCDGLTVTTSAVSGTPSSTGQCGITWTVRDTDGDTDTHSLQISVAADTSPTFSSSGTSRSVIAGQYFSFSRPSASGGNSPLRYSVSGSCAGLTVTTSSVSGSPRSAGRCGITWTVRDTDGDTDTHSLQISVAADTSPTFSSSGTSRSVIAGQYFSFSRPSASGGNSPLRYSVSGSCSGLTVTTSSVSGSPRSAGRCGISWTVRDTDGDTDTYSLQISVAADRSPTFSSSGTSRSAITGQYFSFSRPSASGGNSPLRYSVSGSCSGLTVTTSSVSGSPRSASRCGITWTVRDTDGDTDTYSLQISVAADTSPTFSSSGASRSAIVGRYFSFTRPSARGGNSPLRYSVSGSCAGLTVTTSSVSGSPRSTGQCGITWTVRDTDGDTATYSLQLSVRQRGA